MKLYKTALIGIFFATAAPLSIAAEDKCAPYSTMFEEPSEEIMADGAYMECMKMWHGEMLKSEGHVPMDHPPLDGNHGPMRDSHGKGQMI